METLIVFVKKHTFLHQSLIVKSQQNRIVLVTRPGTIQLNDQLLEVNGVSVTSKSLNEVIPLLQESNGNTAENVIKLKLARLISIPERDFSAGLAANSFLLTFTSQAGLVVH